MLYYVSRLIYSRNVIASKIIKMKFDTVRSSATIGTKIKTERNSVGLNGPNDFYDEDDKTFDPVKVDTVLGNKFPDTGELEQLLGIKDGEIVDEKVLDILIEDV